MVLNEIQLDPALEFDLFRLFVLMASLCIILHRHT